MTSDFLSCVFIPTAVMPVRCHDEGRKEIYNSVSCPLHRKGYQMHAQPRRQSTGEHLFLGQLFSRALAGLESSRMAGLKLPAPFINKREHNVPA